MDPPPRLLLQPNGWRAGGRSAAGLIVRTHLEDQPLHFTKYSSLPCGERERKRRVSERREAEGSRLVPAGLPAHLAESLAEDALGGEDLLSHAAQLLHGAGWAPSAFSSSAAASGLPVAEPALCLHQAGGSGSARGS